MIALVIFIFAQSTYWVDKKICFEIFEVKKGHTHTHTQIHTSLKRSLTVLNCWFSFHIDMLKKSFAGASLVVQWLRICLLMQGTRVRAPVWEDPTCRRAARPVSHNY